MELAADLKLPIEKVFDILVQVREAPHIDDLNYFKQDESLEGLSREDLETKLNKSLGIDTVEVSRIFRKSFDRVDLVRLAHFAIEEANQLTSGKEKGQKRKKNVNGEPSKKPKPEDVPVS